MQTDINDTFLFFCKQFIPASNERVHNFLSYLNFFITYRKILKISPGAYIYQRLFLRGLCTEGNLRFKISWASLQWEGNLPFLLCFTLYSRANSKYKLPRGLYWEGRFNGGFFALRFCRAYIWRGLYMEGLIFRILWYACIDLVIQK